MADGNQELNDAQYDRGRFLSLREIQEASLALLCEFAKICADNGLRC